MAISKQSRQPQKTVTEDFVRIKKKIDSSILKKILTRKISAIIRKNPVIISFFHEKRPGHCGATEKAILHRFKSTGWKIKAFDDCRGHVWFEIW